MRRLCARSSTVHQIIPEVSNSWCSFLRRSAALRRGFLHHCSGLLGGHESPVFVDTYEGSPNVPFTALRLFTPCPNVQTVGGVVQPSLPVFLPLYRKRRLKVFGATCSLMPADRRHRHGRACLCHRRCHPRCVCPADTKIRYSRLNPGTGSVQNTKVRTFWNLLAAPSATVPGTLSQFCLHGLVRANIDVLFSTATALALCRGS